MSQMISIPKEEYEEIEETFEILKNPETALRILRSIGQSKKGEVISESEFVRRFGLQHS